jgi:hypothetical protein
MLHNTKGGLLGSNTVMQQNFCMLEGSCKVITKNWFFISYYKSSIYFRKATYIWVSSNKNMKVNHGLSLSAENCLMQIMENMLRVGKHTGTYITQKVLYVVHLINVFFFALLGIEPQGLAHARYVL